MRFYGFYVKQKGIPARLRHTKASRMPLLQQLAAAFPLESPWTAAIVFGALAWLPFRTIALKIRRWRRKDMDRSILRGGRFTSEHANHDSSVLSLATRTAVQFVIDSCCWKKKVLFEKHSDGRVLSKRYVYDRQKPPQDAVLHVQIQTPSPMIPHKRRSRIATPTVKKKSVSSSDKENDNPISLGVGAKAQPRAETSKTTKNHFETTSTQSQQPIDFPIDFRLSPYDRSKQLNQGLTMMPYRPQSVPLGPAGKPEARQPSFLDKPLDPHFFLAYAPKGSFITQVNPSAIPYGSSKAKKRKLDVDSYEGPRKRPTLSRGHNSRAIRRKPVDPQKRKAREDELLLEFSRKRPKKEAKQVDSAVKVVANPFAPAAEAGTSDGKPTFQFGATSTTTTTGASDDKKSDGKPVFQFGSATPTIAASDDEKSDGKPAFQFGATATTTAASDDTKSDGKPVFQFGEAATTTASDDTKSYGKPAFQFGVTTTSTAASRGTSAETMPQTFQFGAASVSSLTDAQAGDSTSVATKQVADVQKPSFTFGASATSAAPGPSVAFTTGTHVTATDSSAPKPAFSFGSSAHAEAAGAPQPAFAFGGAAPAAAGGNNSNPFSFGGSGATTAFGAPASAMLPGPVSRGGALRRRAGRSVGGRSQRRGAS
jgi:hypothetical protein